MEEEIKESKLIKYLEPKKLISKTGNPYKQRHGIYECCYCGIEFKANIQNLKKNKIAKGCKKCNNEIKAKNMIKHGDHDSRLYQCWASMKSRCSENYEQKHYYHDKGVKVCNKWNDYVEFRKWSLENGYSNDLTLDRIDSDGNYEPSNCRWATKSEQAANTSKSKNNTSGYTGVHFRKDTKKWDVSLYLKSKKHTIGSFEDIKEAALARDTFIIVYGLPHRRNFP